MGSRFQRVPREETQEHVAAGSASERCDDLAVRMLRRALWARWDLPGFSRRKGPCDLCGGTWKLPTVRAVRNPDEGLNQNDF
jgi:hypothetical protein